MAEGHTKENSFIGFDGTIFLFAASQQALEFVMKHGQKAVSVYSLELPVLVVTGLRTCTKGPIVSVLLQLLGRIFDTFLAHYGSQFSWTAAQN